MELRILILGLFLLGVHFHTAVSFENDDTIFVRDYDGAKQTNLTNLKKAVSQLLRSDAPGSFVVTFNNKEFVIWGISNRSDFDYASNDNPGVMSMTTLLSALRLSPLESRVWVFTDEPAKDPAKDLDVVEMSQMLGSPIYFAIYGPRNHSVTPAPGFSTYHYLASATNGHVFYLQKNETGELFNYDEHLRGLPKDVITKQFSTNFESNEFTVTIDSKTSALTIAVTGEDADPEVTVTDPSGLFVATTVVTRLRPITVVKLPVSPGVYKVRVSTQRAVGIVVTTFTSLTFRHGFSAHTPSDFKDTSRIPLPGTGHLSILIDNEEGLELRSVQILDMEYTVLVEAPLKYVLGVDDSAITHFYTTDPISIPDHTFQIALNLHDAPSGINLTWHGSTPITPTLSDKCQQPKEVGPCMAQFPKWYYDNDLKECRKFIFGGCFGNANKFDSEAECRGECGAPAPVIDKCQQPKEVGPCMAQFPKWYYDNDLKECRKFIFGGCRGNANKFDSEAECRGECGAPAPVIDKCQQPVDVGPCTAQFPKWYYDNDLKECRKFIFGGCRGNANKFDSEAECRGECGAPAPVIDKCQQPVDVGPCTAQFPKWYYDNDLKECRKFIFGGCRGNANKFDSEAECRGECGAPAPVIDKCQQPKEVGPCMAQFPKWYYDNDLKECRKFIFGGCRGNANKFDSEAECRGECGAPAPVIDKCQQPVDVGPCTAQFPKWYYDNDLKECRKFIFGGCRGNANKFDSEAECRGECGAPAPVIDKCQQPVDVGPCTAQFPKWYYDNDLKECRKFIFGGCRGNANKFDSEAECRGECGAPAPVIDKCQQPVDVGPCMAHFSKWYYDNDHKECREFIFGGCQGNANKFDSEAECRGECGAPAPVIDKCQQPVDVGPCMAHFSKWYYDNDHKECREFIFGGCRGNANKFDSEAECRGECGAPAPVIDKCQQPVDVGPCTAQFPKWYYDNDLKECREFIFGGCQGNANKFDSEAECRGECGAPAPVIDKCKQPVVPGPCRAEFPMWYYDHTSKICRWFYYSGCDGNQNRFGSEAECTRECGTFAPLDTPTPEIGGGNFINIEPPPNTTETINRGLAATEGTPNMQKNITCRQRDNELETFGRYVASSLRKLNNTFAINAQDEIQAILSKYKLRNLERTSS